MSLVGTKGGNGVWQRIVSEMPEHDVFIDAFWGRGTITRKKRPAAITIGCDLCSDAISDGVNIATMFQCDSVDWLRGYFSGSADGKLRDRRSTDAAVAADNLRSHAATYGGFPMSRHLVYLDPPYRGYEHYYDHRADHADVTDLFWTLPCDVMLSGYHDEYYAARLDDARAIQIPTVNRAGKRCEEWLWMNFDPPKRYHDTRYAGNGRRERERIRRKVNNWSEGLLRMQPIERQAVMDALTTLTTPLSEKALAATRVPIEEWGE